MRVLNNDNEMRDIVAEVCKLIGNKEVIVKTKTGDTHISFMSRFRSTKTSSDSKIATSQFRAATIEQ